MLVMLNFKYRITLEFRNFIYGRLVMNILIASIYITAAFEHRFDGYSYLCVGKYMVLMSVGVLF